MTWMQGFDRHTLTLAEACACVRTGGARDKPTLVLLHGFPQTHVVWHRVAQALARDFFLVMPDLRGHGDSRLLPGVPAQPDHRHHSKRAMAADVVAVLDALGVERFFLCGHDRGGRVAHRLALDFPERVMGLCVIGIAPTLDMYARTDMAFAQAYHHWFHLIQPAPLPETMIGGNADAYLLHTFGRWGAGGTAHIEPEALAEYRRCFCRPETIHSTCEDHRASAGIDLEHDRHSREQGQRIACPTLALWGDRGVIHRLFDPRSLWQAQCALTVAAEALPAGHFIPEELPETTAWALQDFFHP